MAQQTRLDLLLKEIDDEYVQENFRKLRRYLECLDSGTAGPRGLQGPAGAPGEDAHADVLGPIIIPAGDTVAVDSGLFSLYRRANYEIELYNVVNDSFVSFKMSTVKNNADADFNVYAILGGPVARVINFSVVGADVIFAVTNSEAFDLTFQAVKTT